MSERSGAASAGPERSEGKPVHEGAARAGEPSSADEFVQTVLAPGTVENPFTRYRRLRELAPVHRVEHLNLTLLSRFADCQRVLGDRDTFPVVDIAWMVANIPGWQPSPGQEAFLSSLFFRNAPEHTRLRRHLSRGFTTRRLEVLRPVVEQAAVRALDRLVADGAGGRAVDFQETVAFPLSYGVLGDLLGVPSNEQAWCWDLLNVAVPPPAPHADEPTRAERERRAGAASAELLAFFTELVAKRRAEPRDDLVSAAIAEHRDEPEPLTDRELALAVLPIFGAGTGTLSDTLGNAVHAFATHPEQRDRLLGGDPAARSTATAEVVRYCGAYHVVRRYVSRDVDIDGVQVPAGSVVVLLLAAANRDPDRYADPDAFDVGRDDAGTLAFGAGIHYCLGAALARLQIEAVIAALDRVPELRLAGPARWRPSLLFFGPEVLPVTVGPG